MILAKVVKIRIIAKTLAVPWTSSSRVDLLRGKVRTKVEMQFGSRIRERMKLKNKKMRMRGTTG